MRAFSHIAIVVQDLEEMERFYRAVFDMKTVWKRPGDKAYLTTGNNDILGLLRGRSEPRSPVDLGEIEDSAAQTPNFPHFGLVVDTVKEFDDLLCLATERGLEIAGPKSSRDVTTSFYFHDPEGNCLQVVYAPPEYFGSEPTQPS